MYIRSMHNRTGPDVESRELRLIDGLVLAPFIAAILLFALYPQVELHRAEKSVVASVAAAQAAAGPQTPKVAAGALSPMLALGRYAGASGGVRTVENSVTVTVK